MEKDFFWIYKSLELNLINHIPKKKIYLKKKKKESNIEFSSEKITDKKISSFIFFFKKSFFDYKFLKIQRKFLKILPNFASTLNLKWRIEIYIRKIFSKSFFLDLGPAFFLKKFTKKVKKFNFPSKNFLFFLKGKSDKKLKKKNKNGSLIPIKPSYFFLEESNLIFYLNRIKIYFIQHNCMG